MAMDRGGYGGTIGKPGLAEDSMYVVFYGCQRKE